MCNISDKWYGALKKIPSSDTLAKKPKIPKVESRLKNDEIRDLVFAFVKEGPQDVSVLTERMSDLNVEKQERLVFVSRVCDY